MAAFGPLALRSLQAGTAKRQARLARHRVRLAVCAYAEVPLAVACQNVRKADAASLDVKRYPW